MLALGEAKGGESGGKQFREPSSRAQETSVNSYNQCCSVVPHCLPCPRPLKAAIHYAISSPTQGHLWEGMQVYQWGQPECTGGGQCRQESALEVGQHCGGRRRLGRCHCAAASSCRRQKLASHNPLRCLGGSRCHCNTHVGPVEVGTFPCAPPQHRHSTQAFLLLAESCSAL
jgi:hypothetical protein